MPLHGGFVAVTSTFKLQTSNSTTDYNIFAEEGNGDAVLCFGGIGVCHDPLVYAHAQAVFGGLGDEVGLVTVGAARQYANYSVAAGLAVAGGVVECCSEELYACSGGDFEGFDLGCVEFTIFHFGDFAEKEDYIIEGDIELAASVEL